MLFKKKEVSEEVQTSEEEISEEVQNSEEPVVLTVPDIFDYVEKYIEQLHSDARLGKISQEFHDCEMDRIITKIDELKKVCTEETWETEEEFNERVHKVIDSIFAEIGGY